MKVIMKKMGEIKPYEKNPRHNDEAVELVKNSIEKFGWKVPIVVDKKGVIIAGHTRYKAALQMGLNEVPVVVADDLNAKQAKAYRLADNKVGEAATWDFDLLDDELGELAEDFNMGDFGFDDEAADEEEAVVEDDFDPEPPEEPKAKAGQIYKLGRHRLMCGDSTSADDVAKLMDGIKADMVFTDPPYNVAVGSKNKLLNELNHKKRGKRIEEDIHGDKGMTDEEVGEQIWRPAFQNMRDFANGCCSIYCTMPQGGAHMMMMMMANASWQVKHELIWVKNQQTFSMGRLDYEYKHEPILYGWAKTHKFYGNGKFQTSVWEFPKPQSSKLHPTMKPVELVVNAIFDSSKENDVVLDLFGGSGTTVIACEQTDRRCCMMEYEPKYIDVIIRRWELFTGQKAELIEG